jgi:hypothetical protein
MDVFLDVKKDQLAQNIDEVLDVLDSIILEAKSNECSLGYFAALYRKVTYQVKLGIENKEFEDNERMARLDVVFANRYIEAYRCFQTGDPITASWKLAFESSKNKNITVLQHLLLGMNAHINLDLGIAANEIMEGQNIESLKNDFNKINSILSSLVEDVENDMAEIWPFLSKILKWTSKIDNLMVDFSMMLARDGAWRFAVRLNENTTSDLQTQIQNRDKKVKDKGELLNNHNVFVRFLFGFIRRGERGTVKEKISRLQD